jgi:hypothetical protein
VNEFLEEKFQTIARHRDRMNYFLKEPDQKTMTFGRRISVQEDAAKEPDA